MVHENDLINKKMPFEIKAKAGLFAFKRRAGVLITGGNMQRMLTKYRVVNLFGKKLKQRGKAPDYILSIPIIEKY